jgi:methyl-accepting chemotaxis protein
MDKSLGRRNLLINPKFQLSFLAYTLGVSVVTIGFFYLADAYFFWKFSQLGKGLGLPPNHVFFQFLDEQKSSKNLYYAVTAAVSIAVLGVWGLLLSHRVAGPLYRLKKHLQAVAEGKTVSDVRFREGDFFPEVADAYNEQMVKYRAAVGVSTPEHSEEDKAAASDRKAA